MAKTRKSSASLRQMIRKIVAEELDRRFPSDLPPGSPFADERTERVSEWEAPVPVIDEWADDWFAPVPEPEADPRSMRNDEPDRVGGPPPESSFWMHGGPEWPKRREHPEGSRKSGRKSASHPDAHESWPEFHDETAFLQSQRKSRRKR
ncbi:hypothetical protein [Staphylospora marina]|uniref:hypothetical protein n=1 Tax=Staphylospora marina TaxID=2490858 RepID=UPI000F5B962E|nr:hypothetical protein [Staphylospora marina]